MTDPAALPIPNAWKRWWATTFVRPVERSRSSSITSSASSLDAAVQNNLPAEVVIGPIAQPRCAKTPSRFGSATTAVIGSACGCFSALVRWLALPLEQAVRRLAAASSIATNVKGVLWCGAVMRSSLATRVAAAVRERAARNRDELPVVTRRVQRQLEDTPRAVVADLTVRNGRSERVAVAHAAGASDDLTDPVRVGAAARVLPREPLVVVLVAVEDDLCMSSVEVLPDRVPIRVAPVRRARRPARLVPVREGALVRVCRQVLPKPRLLGAAGGGVDGGAGCQ